MYAQPRLLYSPRNPSATNVEAFRRAVNRQHPELNLQNYHDLHRYSVSNYEFWMDLWRYLGIVYSHPPHRVLEVGRFVETPRWFPGARLNYAENILRRNDDALACTEIRESGTVVRVTFRALRELVRQMAGAMRVYGLSVGDRVAAITTNSITTIVLMLATASVGGIFTSTSPDMGSKVSKTISLAVTASLLAKGVLDRYRQTKPKFLFVETEVLYAAKVTNLMSRVSEVISDLLKHGLSLAVLLPSTLTGDDITGTNISSSVHLSEFLSRDDGRELLFSQLPFDQELLILYSSGTTGMPKCIVHSAGGVLLQTMKDIAFGYGVTEHDTLLQYTTTGWMMWNLMVAALGWGTHLILYDGSPFHPSIPEFMRLIHREGVSILGIGPRFLAELCDGAIGMSCAELLNALRTIASGGAFLSAALHERAQATFGHRIRVFTACGGTDVCTAFVTSSPSEPVYAGEIPCIALGMKIEVYNQAGVNIGQTGEAGEMVVTRPHPSIPLYFWGDHSGHKFRSTYYDTFPGVWRQGDFIMVNPTTNGMVILGRSDAILNRGGIRFGSGEIYSALDKFATCIEDTLCISQRRQMDDDERILLFVKMRSGQKLTNVLVANIKSRIKDALTPRHVPDHIFEVQAIPYTMNGKKIEIAVQKIVSGYGSSLTSSEGVANPEALELYYQYTKLPPVVRGLRAIGKL